MKKRKVPTEIYSRVVGYMRPVKNWNKGKQEEFKMRHEWDINGGNKGDKHDKD